MRIVVVVTLALLLCWLWPILLLVLPWLLLLSTGSARNNANLRALTTTIPGTFASSAMLARQQTLWVRVEANAASAGAYAAKEVLSGALHDRRLNRYQ